MIFVIVHWVFVSIISQPRWQRNIAELCIHLDHQTFGFKDTKTMGAKLPTFVFHMQTWTCALNTILFRSYISQWGLSKPQDSYRCGLCTHCCAEIHGRLLIYPSQGGQLILLCTNQDNCHFIAAIAPLVHCSALKTVLPLWCNHFPHYLGWSQLFWWIVHLFCQRRSLLPVHCTYDMAEKTTAFTGRWQGFVGLVPSICSYFQQYLVDKSNLIPVRKCLKLLVPGQSEIKIDKDPTWKRTRNAKWVRWSV